MMDNVQPNFHKTRPLPVPLRDTVEAELSRLEQDNIIRKVDHNDWSAPIVVLPTANTTANLWRYQGNRQSEC